MYFWASLEGPSVRKRKKCLAFCSQISTSELCSKVLPLEKDKNVWLFCSQISTSELRSKVLLLEKEKNVWLFAHLFVPLPAKWNRKQYIIIK